MVGASLPSVNTAMSTSLWGLDVLEAQDPNRYITSMEGNLAMISGTRFSRWVFTDMGVFLIQIL